MDKMNLSDVVGTCLSNAEISEKYDISIEDVEEELLNINIERCPECGWWVESWELVDMINNDELAACMSCRGYQ